MKTIALAFFLLGSTFAFAQQSNDTKLKQDLGYSSSNYKHANKAATAKKWEQSKENTLVVKKNNFAEQTAAPLSYKAQGQTSQGVSNLIVKTPGKQEVFTNPSEAPGNYKRHHATKKSKSSMMASQDKQSTETSTDGSN